MSSKEDLQMKINSMRPDLKMGLKNLCIFGLK